MIGNSDNDLGKEDDYYSRFIEQQVDGLITVPTGEQAPDSLMRLRDLGTPLSMLTVFTLICRAIEFWPTMATPLRRVFNTWLDEDSSASQSLQGHYRCPMRESDSRAIVVRCKRGI